MEIRRVITLSKAIKSGKLPEFIAQEEARGIGPADSKDFELAIKEFATHGPIKPKQSKDRTSRSASRDGSRGK